jgi:hypothetical protein
VLSRTSRTTQERSATMPPTSRLELTNIIGRMPTHSAKIRVICKSGKRAGTNYRGFAVSPIGWRLVRKLVALLGRFLAGNPPFCIPGCYSCPHPCRFRFQFRSHLQVGAGHRNNFITPQIHNFPTPSSCPHHQFVNHRRAQHVRHILRDRDKDSTGCMYVHMYIHT